MSGDVEIPAVIVDRLRAQLRAALTAPYGSGEAERSADFFLGSMSNVLDVNLDECFAERERREAQNASAPVDPWQGPSRGREACADESNHV